MSALLAEPTIEHWGEFFVNPNKVRGFIATLDLSGIKSPYPIVNFWGLNDMHQLIEYTNGTRVSLTNLFTSLNSFEEKNGELARKASNIAQIRNIGIDVDCYKVGLSVDQVIEKIVDLIVKGVIPNPNLIIYSGNGVQLIYGIKGGAAPTNEIKWLASYITHQFTAKLAHLGGDYQSATLERVFRLPGTWNAKPAYGRKLVTSDIWRSVEYTLTELYEYCEPYPKQKYPKLLPKTREIPLESFRTYGKSVRQLNMARVEDFLTLVQLRQGHIENRNILTYDYCFARALNGLDRSDVQETAVQLDNSFTIQQKQSVLRRTAKSAYDDAEAFWMAYAKNGYSMQGLDRNLIKPKKNITLIEQHGITAEEMEHLKTIIGKEERYKRKVAKRRSEGMRAMAEYNNARKVQVMDKLEQLKELKLENPKASQRKFAEIMGVSQSTVRNLMKQL